MSVIAFDPEEFKAAADLLNYHHNDKEKLELYISIYDLFFKNHSNYKERYKHHDDIKNYEIMSLAEFLNLNVPQRYNNAENLINTFAMLTYNCCDYEELDLDNYKTIERILSNLSFKVRDKNSENLERIKFLNEKLTEIEKYTNPITAKDLKVIILEKCNLLKDDIKVTACKDRLRFNIYYYNTNHQTVIREFCYNSKVLHLNYYMEYKK